MNSWTSGRPVEWEYAPHAKAYVECVPEGDVMDILRAQVGKTLSMIEPLDEQRASEWAYAPGKWTVKQVLGHMADTERIFSYRILRVARGDKTPLPGFEQDDYISYADSNQRPLTDLGAEFRAIRESSLILVRSLKPEDWSRTGTIGDRELSVRGLVFTMAGHEIHHANILRDRYGV